MNQLTTTEVSYKRETISFANELLKPNFHRDADWAVEIKRLYAEGRVQTLDLAKVVLAAKLQLKRKWACFWRTSGDELPFKKRTAEMLATIARLAGLSAQTFAHLPRGWSILYQLARLPLERLEQLVADGIVHPKLTLAKARELAKRPGPSKPKRFPVKARLLKLRNFVQETHQHWTMEQRRLASATLRELLFQIESNIEPFVILSLAKNAAPPAESEQITGQSTLLLNSFPDIRNRP